MRSGSPVQAPYAVVRPIINGRVRWPACVSWDDDYGRLNVLVLALGLLAVAAHFAPPWFGAGS